MKAFMYIAVIIVAGTAGMLAAAEKIYCTSCKKRISGDYLRSNTGKTYCNRTCAEKQLPKCSACSKRIYGNLLRLKDKQFCSERCLQTVMPKCDLCAQPMRGWTLILGKKFCERCNTLPKCTECMVPANKGQKYQDSRFVCSTCGRSTIFKVENANVPYLKARKELKRITGMETDVVPPLKLVSQDRILELAFTEMKHKPQGVIRGFYARTEHYRDKGDEKPSSIDREVLMLYGMRRNTYFITGVHESTHDLIAEKFPRLKQAPGWVHEGLCQYLASIAAAHHKLDSHYLAIASHPDGAYGDGFRYFQQTFGKNNWRRVKGWMETVDVTTLPKILPEKYHYKRPE